MRVDRRLSHAVAVLSIALAASSACGSDSGTGAGGGATVAAATTTVVAQVTTDPTTTVARAGKRQSLVGMWKASDGTGLKEFTADGRCSGMIYSGTQPMDIGGTMTCMLGSTPDAEGRYTLAVRQPPNKATYAVAFTSADTAQVYRGSALLFSMTRQ